METPEADDFVDDIVYQTAKGDLGPSQAAAKLLSGSETESFRVRILDYIWVHSAVESEEERDRLQDLLSHLVGKGALGFHELVAFLEPDIIPDDVVNSDILRRKRTQTKTKRVYTIPKYNLFSECPEGYSTIVDTLWTVAKFGVSPEHGGVIVDAIRKCIGHYQLCPTKTISILVSILSHDIGCAGSASLLQVLQAIAAPGRTESVILFHVLNASKADKSPDLASSQGLIRTTSMLNQLQLIDLSEIWSVMGPTTSDIASAAKDLISEYQKLVDSVSRTLAGAVGGSDEDQGGSAADKLAKCLEVFSNGLRETQRFQLVAELVRTNQFAVALPLLTIIQSEFGSVPVAAVDILRDALFEHLLSLVGDRMDSDEVVAWLPKILQFMGVFVGCNHLVLADMFHLIKNCTDTRLYVSLLGQFLLPALSMGCPNPHLCSLAWECISVLPPAERFTVYQAWEASYDSKFPLALVKHDTTNQTRSLLKRVVKGAQIGDTVSRNSHYQFAKLCCCNPLVVLKYVVSNIQIHFNYNLIEPYVDVTSKIPMVAQDIVSYLVTSFVGGDETRPSLNLRTASVEPWLANISEFTGKFLKRHPSTPLDGLMRLVASLMMSSDGGSFLKAAPARVLLEAIIEHMGDFSMVHQLNAEQIEAISGGPILNSLVQASQSSTTVESVRLVERAKTALKQALLAQPGLVQTIYYCLGRQLSDLTTSQEVAQELIKGGGLKLLGILYDGIHSCLLQLTEFLRHSCDESEYRQTVPSDNPLFLFHSSMDTAIAFHILRPGWQIEWTGKIAHAVFPSTTNVSNEMFETFWKLSLSDISVPTGSYDRQSAFLKDRIASQEAVIEKLEKSRDIAESKDQIRTVKRELVRLKDQASKLELERVKHIQTHNAVMAEIRSQAPRWWKEGLGNKLSTLELLSEMISKRVFVSIQDAIFCSQFVKLLVTERVPGFQFLDFFNQWTDLLAMTVTSSSEGEIKNLAEFAKEMMSFIVDLRRNEDLFSKLIASGNPVFHRGYYSPEKGDVVPISKSELARAHLKWEGQITKALKSGLSADTADWCEKRNCLIMISRTCDIFPIIQVNAMDLMQSVQALAQDSQEDIATLALSLGRKLASLESSWMDKTAAVAVTPPSAASPVPEPSANAKADEDVRMEEISDRETSKKNARGQSTRKAAAPAAPKEESSKRDVRRTDESPKRTTAKRSAKQDSADSVIKRPRADDERNEKHESGRDYSSRVRNPDPAPIPRPRDRGGRR
jgi:hypothetical protein